jgi:hypothetical protein
MAVSDVGRTAMGFSKSDFPPFVSADEDREVGVANFERLDFVVEPKFDEFPDRVRGGLENVACG